ncbi:MAG: ABC transporter permease [Comamonas sp.]
MLRLEARPEASRHMRWLSPLLAVALTLLGGVALFAALGQNPLQGLRVFFLQPVNDLYGVSELLLKATPLMLIGVGLAVGFRAGVWNIGAEGQFICGAVFATGIALQVGDQSAPWAIPAMVVAGAIGGALWAAIPAWLRTRFGTNEILVSLMLVYVAQLLASWLIYGPWKDPDGYNFPQTRNFGDSALLPLLIEGTRLHAGFVLALVVLLAGYVFLQRSFQGFQMQVGGQAPDAARYAGFSANRAIWFGLLGGGALAGVAGMTEVAGPMGQLTSQISAGYGFAAIIVAFVGRLHPVGILGASLLMALFFLGGEQAQQHMNLPSSISKVFQGMLLFFLLASDLFIAYRLRWERTAWKGLPWTAR